MLTVFPVRFGDVDREVAGRGMALAPFAGMLVGLVSSAVLLLVSYASGSAPLASVLAVASTAWLTRGLHLDGLADLADGLGSGKPAGPALDIMKKSDIGPFGVMTLVFTLLTQIAALSLVQRPGMPAIGPLALVTSCTAGRLAVTWACRDGVPSARPGGLGALVAGAVRRSWAVAATVVSASVLGGAAWAAAHWAASPPGSDAGLRLRDTLGGPPATVAACLLAVGAGLAAAAVLRRRAVRRLGGVTGDVFGALIETATTAALLTWAVL
ncbi:adenosylcobinamide-GDP ribazoletransferase [Planotetraspora thailandica]|uniref:Adenosylcobinamide-GDP ribazoletransferase n=2 Tax=Planotetraspora thailandica TaxID=487172 RepID=A0A8J3V2A8_9ACTN|nr:adenosylcobinamide-GDP ribazoletransferase [Planotetraspora thailandica]